MVERSEEEEEEEINYIDYNNPTVVYLFIVLLSASRYCKPAWKWARVELFG